MTAEKDGEKTSVPAVGRNGPTESERLQLGVFQSNISCRMKLDGQMEWVKDANWLPEREYGNHCNPPFS